MSDTNVSDEQYDVIVVGAGAAGAPLAARLSENPDRRVLLLEAGADYPDNDSFPPEILNAITMDWAAPGYPGNWAFDGRITDERTVPVARGKLIGGSTSLNATYFIRAPRTDFDHWADLGNTEWSYEKVLPFFRKMEDDRDYGATDVHGAGGPMPVRRDAPLHPITTAFFAACAELGYPEEMDKNAGAAPGYGLLPVNNLATIRQNTAMGYLNPIRAERPNLTIRGNAAVRRVLFEGSVAVGVEADVDGRREVIRGSEIVLSAGAVKSPHLLLLSGVGPAAELASHGIPVVADRAGVGKEFGDHPNVSVTYRRTDAGASDDGSLWMQGLLNFTATGSEFPSDLQIICRTKPFRMPSDDLLILSTCLQQQASRGELTLQSSDPAVQPRVDYHYMTEESDLRRTREAIRVGVRLLQTDAFRPYVAELVDPAPDVVADDAALDRWILDNVGTNIHLSSSCRMGAADDPMAVVDQRGRVHGVTGLRVADTSILPNVPSRGTSATTVMIGERVAALMDEEDR